MSAAVIDLDNEETANTNDPLRDCPLLSKIAIVGKERILEMASRPIDYVWQDIAVRGTIVMLAGGPSSGKTTLLFLILAARLSREKPVTLLGREVSPALKGKYLVIIEGEHGEISSTRKIARSCEILGVDDNELDSVILVARKAVHIGDPAWDEVTKLVAEGLVTDIALDTIARVAPGDSNSEQEQVAIFDLVAKTIEAAPSEVHKPTVWAVAHTRKNNKTGGPEDVLGSTQRAGQADSVAIVEGTKSPADGSTFSTKAVWVKLREEPDNYPPTTEYTIRVGEDGRREIHVHGAPDKSVPLETQIERALAGGPRTKGALQKGLNRNAEDIQKAIDNLFGAHKLVIEYVDVRGRPCKGFALRRS